MTYRDELNINELDAVVGGCDHGSGTCKAGSGQGDGLGQLRQLEGAIIEAGKTVVNTIINLF